MNSINWPDSSVWVFIAQLGEHCSANAEATGSKFYFHYYYFHSTIFVLRLIFLWGEGVAVTWGELEVAEKI